jgi:hypothetical protein
MSPLSPPLVAIGLHGVAASANPFGYVIARIARRSAVYLCALELTAAFDSQQRADRKSTKIGANPNLPLVSPGKSAAMRCWFNNPKVASAMPDHFHTPSELVEISKLNGSFKRNYGTFIGACLYLRSISAARGRSYLWSSFWFALASVGVTWLEKNGLI